MSSLAGKKQAKSALASALVFHDTTRQARWIATQYAIVALHGHGDPKAAEIYTRRVDRRKLVESAMGCIDLGTIIE